MNREEAYSKIVDTYPGMLSENIFRGINNVLDALYNNGLTVAPAQSDMTATDQAEFEQTILQWNANEAVELEDINGAAIIQALQTRGWVILPPS
jgi:hypothetical protein